MTLREAAASFHDRYPSPALIIVGESVALRGAHKERDSTAPFSNVGIIARTESPTDSSPAMLVLANGSRVPERDKAIAGLTKKTARRAGITTRHTAYLSNGLTFL